MHVVLKSEQAKAQYRFLRFERELVVLLRRLAVNFNIQVEDAVVMSNHIHLALRVRSRRAFQNYLRALSVLTSLV